jgi:SAM-dependent methyltransferase
MVIQEDFPYGRYAEVYDRIGQRAFGERMAEAVLSWLPDGRQPPRHVLDLACGTGAATLIFAAHGARVVGLDRSPPMLAGAREATATAGLAIDFIEGDIREITVEGPFDLVTCFYDSINYLLEIEELVQCFAGVQSVLDPDGFFFFDVNTRAKLNAWGEAPFIAVDRPELFGVYEASYDPVSHRSPLRLTFFIRDEGDTTRWQRFDEEHVERGYLLSEIDDALKRGGLERTHLVEIPNQGGPPGRPGTERSHRVLFVARLPRPLEAAPGAK